MTLIQKIKAAQLQSRKDRDIIRSSLLTTIIGEAEMFGKNADNRAPTDTEVVQVLKKFEKNLNETIGHLKTRGTPSAALVQWFAELEIVREFLPQKLTDEKVKDDIGLLFVTRHFAREQKSLGEIVRILKNQYGDQFDGQQVSTVFKSML